MIGISFLLPLPVLMATYVHSSYTTKQEEQALVNTKSLSSLLRFFAESFVELLSRAWPKDD